MSMCSHLDHLHVEVVGYSSQVTKVIFCIRTGVMPWWKKLAALEQVHGENEDLVPRKNLAHAISTAEAERNQPLVLDKPLNRYEREFEVLVFTFHHPTKIWLDQRYEDL